MNERGVPAWPHANDIRASRTGLHVVLNPKLRTQPSKALLHVLVAKAPGALVLNGRETVGVLACLVVNGEREEREQTEFSEVERVPLQCAD
jgi:hypothetical protein